MTVEQYAQVLLSPNNKIGISTSYVNRFRSWCRFDQAYESYWLQNKNKWGNSSVKQYEGAHIFDYLFWDIDKETPEKQADIAGATLWLSELLEHAEKTWGLSFDQFRIWMTAGKGYHPYLPSGLFQPWPHDLNTAATVHFTAQFFPAGWVGKYQMGGKLDPVTFKDLNRIDRQGGSQNFKENRDWNGFKTGLRYEDWLLLKNDSSLYFELSKEPTELYLSEDYITGEAYWQLEPVPKLVELWKESIEKAIVEKEGRKLSNPKTTSATTNSTGHNFYIPENLEVPQCIRNMHKQLQSGEIKGGFRHGVFMVLASFYSRLLPQSAVLALMTALNESLSAPKTTDEIEKIVTDVFERGYRTGCGNPNSDLGQTCLAFCNSRASLDECPKHKVSEDGGLIAQRSTGIYTAYNRMVERSKAGPSPIIYGIEEWDTPVGCGHRLGQMHTIVGYPESSKTATVTRISQVLCETAKKLNMLVLLFTPEHDIETVAELLVQQRGKLTGEGIYKHTSNGGLDPALAKWFQDMEDTLIPVNSVFFTIQDIERTLKYWEKKLGKKTMCVILDGVIFFSHGELGKTRRPDEEVAKYLKGLCVSWPYYGIYNLHVEKQGGSENDKDKKPNEQKLKGNAGFGTGHYYNASEFYTTLHRRDGDVVWSIKKFRSGYKGIEPPKEILFKFHRPHYYPYSRQEVADLIATQGIDFFGGDPAYLLPSRSFKLDLQNNT